jgi:hypothetical protein
MLIREKVRKSKANGFDDLFRWASRKAMNENPPVISFRNT